MNDTEFMMAGQKPRQATESAINYFVDLYKGRDHEDKVSQLPPVWQETFHAIAANPQGTWAASDVSKFIDLLKTCDKIGPASKPIRGSAVAANPPTVDGIYRKNGKYFKVYWSRDDKRLLAKEIVLLKEAGLRCSVPECDLTPEQSEAQAYHDHEVCDFIEKPAVSELVYKGAAYRFVTADDRYEPTLEEALAFGPTYGRCGLCGRNLNDELSVKLGIGPVCGGREFGQRFKIMKKIAEADLAGQADAKSHWERALEGMAK